MRAWNVPCTAGSTAGCMHGDGRFEEERARGRTDRRERGRRSGVNPPEGSGLHAAPTRAFPHAISLRPDAGRRETPLIGRRRIRSVYVSWFSVEKKDSPPDPDRVRLGIETHRVWPFGSFFGRKYYGESFHSVFLFPTILVGYGSFHTIGSYVFGISGRQFQARDASHGTQRNQRAQRGAKVERRRNIAPWTFDFGLRRNVGEGAFPPRFSVARNIGQGRAVQ